MILEVSVFLFLNGLIFVSSFDSEELETGFFGFLQDDAVGNLLDRVGSIYFGEEMKEKSIGIAGGFVNRKFGKCASI